MWVNLILCLSILPVLFSNFGELDEIEVKVLKEFIFENCKQNLAKERCKIKTHQLFDFFIPCSLWSTITVQFHNKSRLLFCLGFAFYQFLPCFLPSYNVEKYFECNKVQNLQLGQNLGLILGAITFIIISTFLTNNYIQFLPAISVMVYFIFTTIQTFTYDGSQKTYEEISTICTQINGQNIVQGFLLSLSYISLTEYICSPSEKVNEITFSSTFLLSHMILSLIHI
eukprot:TRINITY_DN15928_c0_g1_i2.p1 TRINITY_DN15928_c0_g1~~TRINITY_DN15928_c0_g1_i2.p1  ORF type:complete len:227 (-),score=23.24 TRINITY_DN15928_c0_g1_i2:167-847(-)